MLALLLTREIAVVVATLRRTTRLMGMRARRGPACGSGATLASAVTREEGDVEEEEEEEEEELVAQAPLPHRPVAAFRAPHP